MNWKLWNYGLEVRKTDPSLSLSLPFSNDSGLALLFHSPVMDPVLDPDLLTETKEIELIVIGYLLRNDPDQYFH